MRRALDKLVHRLSRLQHLGGDFTAPNGETVEELALIDTGASYSSIDEEIAEEDLGLDLEDVPTVEVSSALGDEERPLVHVDIQVAGRTIPAQVNVSDRSDRDEKVLLGREQLAGYRVAVGQSQLTSPDEPIASSGAAEAPSVQTSALAPTTLLAMLPLCASGLGIDRHPTMDECPFGHLEEEVVSPRRTRLLFLSRDGLPFKVAQQEGTDASVGNHDYRPRASGSSSSSRSTNAGPY